LTNKTLLTEQVFNFGKLPLIFTVTATLKVGVKSRSFKKTNLFWDTKLQCYRWNWNRKL